MTRRVALSALFFSLMFFFAAFVGGGKIAPEKRVLEDEGVAEKPGGAVDENFYTYR